MRRREPAALAADDVPGWVVSFDPADWPIIDDGAVDRRFGARGRLILMDASDRRLLDLGEVETVQRSAWNRARRNWAAEHRVSLLDMIRARRIEGVYDHLRVPR